MQRSQSAVPSKLSPWICVGRALYPHRVQWHGGVVRTVLPECQQTGVQSACALRRATHTQREREMQAATTPLTLIASNRGSPWDRAECSLGKNPPVQLLPSVWYLFIPASVGVLLLWSFQSSQDLCWERAAPIRPVRRTADWHSRSRVLARSHCTPTCLSHKTESDGEMHNDREKFHTWRVCQLNLV